MPSTHWEFSIRILKLNVKMGQEMSGFFNWIPLLQFPKKGKRSILNDFQNFSRLINNHNLGLFLIALKFEFGYFFRSKIKFKLPEWSLVILISCWSESWCWPIVIQQRFHFYVLSLFSFHLRNNQINKWPTLIRVLRCSWMVLNE